MKEQRFRIDLRVFQMLIKPLMKANYNNLSTLQILKIKRGFEDYLAAFDSDILLNIPDSVVKVFMNMSHPLKTNGFNPETILHFIEFSKTFELK